MFVVETYTLIDGWVNCWNVDGDPMTFETQEEAARELFEHATDCRENNMDFDPADYRITEERK